MEQTKKNKFSFFFYLFWMLGSFVFSPAILANLTFPENITIDIETGPAELDQFNSCSSQLAGAVGRPGSRLNSLMVSVGLATNKIMKVAGKIKQKTLSPHLSPFRDKVFFWGKKTKNVLGQECQTMTQEMTLIEDHPINKIFLPSVYLRYHQALIWSNPLVGLTVAGMHWYLENYYLKGAGEKLQNFMQKILEENYPSLKESQWYHFLSEVGPQMAAETFKLHRDPYGQTVGYLAFYMTHKLLASFKSDENPSPNRVQKTLNSFLKWAGLTLGTEFGANIVEGVSHLPYLDWKKTFANLQLSEGMAPQTSCLTFFPGSPFY